ncbi:putative transporter [Cladorrhinum sp. PSN332]|nr:putative transporter [Cladorrhinum sp. PSN332]
MEKSLPDTDNDSSREGSTTPTETSFWKRLWALERQAWTPRWCRNDPSKDFGCPTSFIILCTCANAISSANLYYLHPVLNKVANDFGITYEHASLIPRLLQGGYGIGILLLCPLGDVFRIRPLALILTSATALIWIGLCLAPSFESFTALSFLAGLLSVSPQIFIPLVGALAPPHRRATASTIVLAGSWAGFATPQVVAGVVAQYTHWRNIYWVALGLQGLLVGLIFFLFPDLPVRVRHNSSSRLNQYGRILSTILRLAATKPVLAFGCVATFLANAALASFWTVLTAHLSSPDTFNYDPLTIGLFSLIGIGTALMIPIYTYLVIERTATYFSSTLGVLFGIVAICLDSYVPGGVKTLKIGGPILHAFGVEFGIQVASVAARAAIYKSMPTHANKATVVFTACAFAGQLMGTSVGNNLYARGGWSWSSSFHVALGVATLVVVYLRGPKETGWIGWTGGAGFRLESSGHDGGERDVESQGK